MSEHRPEVADVFRTYGDDFLARWERVVSRPQRKAFDDIRACRTAALGGPVDQCDPCGHCAISYNSCRNGSCPKCQGAARAQWLAEREAELLPVEYFHVVFTLPQQIARMALQNARRIYSILFQAVAETLLTIAADPQHLGAAIPAVLPLRQYYGVVRLLPHPSLLPPVDPWLHVPPDPFPEVLVREEMGSSLRFLGHPCGACPGLGTPASRPDLANSGRCRILPSAGLNTSASQR